jgi:hypothetical protein
MGKSSAPPPPDYRGAASEQAEASKEITNIQNFANRPNQYTPFGSQTWSTNATVDPATGQTVTQWNQQTNLNPNLQQALDSQINTQRDRSQLAGGFMDRVRQEYATPFNWGGMPDRANTTDLSGQVQRGLGAGAPPLPQFDSGYRDRVANTLMERMVPVHERQQNQLETQLANQGHTIGSEGYTRALADMQSRQAAERYNALDTAGNEAQRLYNMGMGSRQQSMSELGFGNQALGQQYGLNQQAAAFQNQLRQQSIAEEAQRRGMSLNEMNALMTGQQVGMPQMPSFNQAQRSETPQILSAVGQQYDAQLGAVNAQNAATGNMMGGLFSMGSAALSNPFMFSDRRLKSNIKRVGTHPIGVGLYEYTMMGMPQRGVIAQEVEAVRPDLVKRHANGYLMVNYESLGGLQ